MQTNSGTLFESTGILRYSASNSYKLIAEIDQEIVNYYRYFIPKYLEVFPQKYKAHISIVRKEVPTNLEFWGKYEGEKINFLYQNIIYNGEVYYWLDAYCKKFEDIRTELGLINYWKYQEKTRMSNFASRFLIEFLLS